MNSEQRITDLEIRFAHQDHYLQQLNEIVVNQQKTIERLEKEVLDIKNSIGGVGDVSGIRNLQDEKPPHY